MIEAVGDEGKQPPRLDCPAKWALAPLRAIAHVALGKTPGKVEYRNEGKCKIVKYRDLGDDREIDWSNSEKGFIDCDRAKELNLRYLCQGDILISASAHSSEIIGRKVLYAHHIPDKFDAIYYVGEILCIRINRNMAPDLPKLLNYFFQSLNGYKSIQAKVHGVHLIGSRAAEMIVPIPPKNAQKRIVSKIDELFSRIDEGERALEKVQKLVERYRQSVLKAAVTGELTRGWREKHKAADQPIEPGEALLARILSARREAWERAELAKMQAKGITPANDKWKQKYQEPAAPDTTDLQELPTGWVWVSLGALITWGPQNGLYLHKDNYGRGTPILRIDDYQAGWVRLAADLQKVSAEKADRAKYGVFVGDFIINRVNSVSHLGKCMLVSTEHEGSLFESNMMRFRVSAELSKSYLELFLRSEMGRKQLIKNCKNAVNQASINQDDVAATPIALGPLREQDEIVDSARRELSRVGEESLDTKALVKQALGLRRGILKLAFGGRLVSQELSDEPASLLLAQIAAEHAAIKKPKRGAVSGTQEPA